MRKTRTRNIARRDTRPGSAPCSATTLSLSLSLCVEIFRLSVPLLLKLVHASDFVSSVFSLSVLHAAGLTKDASSGQADTGPKEILCEGGEMQSIGPCTRLWAPMGER